ncbi:hypothetical protein LJC33_04525 [Eubacteriales bacterium OttesenSCG-928-N13]|nr:hypothetical protein [Eubacteriales bacterium OttesenSCG-928-N13]
MAFEKCPRCELNYILDGGKLCTVCRKDVNGGNENDDLPEMCSECGERPAILGGELCINCLKEAARRSTVTSTDDEVIPEDPTGEIDSMSELSEIELDLPEDEEFEGEESFEEDDDSIEEPLIEEEDDYLPEDDYGDGNSLDH